jgi:hypothetical protein
VTDPRPDDWARVVLGWIAKAERQMDEAYRVDDGRAYTVAERWRDEMRLMLRVVDPTAEFRFATLAVALAIRGFGETMAGMGPAIEALGVALRDSERAAPDSGRGESGAAGRT